VALRARYPEPVTDVRDVGARRDGTPIEREGAGRTQQRSAVQERGVERVLLGVVEAFGASHGDVLLSIELERGVIMDASSYADRS
jgi:hypothetical protein